MRGPPKVIFIVNYPLRYIVSETADCGGLLFSNTVDPLGGKKKKNIYIYIYICTFRNTRIKLI